MLIATKTDQNGALCHISGPVIDALEDDFGNIHLIVDVWTPIGRQQVLLAWEECTFDKRRLN